MLHSPRPFPNIYSYLNAVDVIKRKWPKCFQIRPYGQYVKLNCGLRKEEDGCFGNGTVRSSLLLLIIFKLNAPQKWHNFDSKTLDGFINEKLVLAILATLPNHRIHIPANKQIAFLFFFLLALCVVHQMQFFSHFPVFNKSQIHHRKQWHFLDKLS